MKILFKFPSRSRPAKLLAGLKNIYENLANKKDYWILVSIDQDDETLRDITEINAYAAGKNIVFYEGISNNKIHAVNRDVNEFTQPWDLLIVMSDDMAFQVPGFDDIIRKDMADNFPDGDGFLHYNDGNQKANVSTMSIMGRRYYSRTNSIYDPSYESVWCDVEATEVAHMLGRRRYMGDENVIFRHLHPAFGLAAYDEQYRKTEDPKTNQKDREVFNERRARNYDLKESVNGYYYKNL